MEKRELLKLKARSTGCYSQCHCASCNREVAHQEFNLVRGFKQELRKLRESLYMVKQVLEDAERRQFTDGTVKLWLKKFQFVAYDYDDVLDERTYEDLCCSAEIWNQMKQNTCLCFSSNMLLRFTWKMTRGIKKINVELKLIHYEADRHGFQRRVADCAPYSPSLRETVGISCDHIVLGRDNDTLKTVNMLIKPSDEYVAIIPIVGIGGLGKATLAHLIFNHYLVEKRFDKRIWVCGSQNFDEIRLPKRISQIFKEKFQRESRQAWDDFKKCKCGINCQHAW